MKKSRLIVIIVTAVILAAAGTALLLGALSPGGDTLASQLELGERYMSELDYEAALLAYKKVLEIDPHNIAAYLGMADALSALGRYEEAMAALTEGYALTGDARLAARMEELLASSDEMHIADPALEAALREVISKPEGTLYYSDFDGVEMLYFDSLGITDITPLARLTNVIHLNLSGNPIADLSPISRMTGLRVLSLVNMGLTDISALEPLHGLTALFIGANEIADLSPLSGMAELSEINFGGNPVTDLTPLAGLTKLRSVTAANTLVTDWSPLAHVESLYTGN